MIAWSRLIAVLLLFALALPARGATPDAVKVLRNVSYGPDRLQAMDVYLPPNAKAAPIILMAHGGGWRRGGKANPGVYENKVARWVPKGFIFISVNYPMVPESDPVEQADDIARALAAAQAAAPSWGGDPTRVMLMGHSAGAHLVSLLNADPSRARELGAKPWLGTISLDSGALDVPAIMTRPHFDLFDTAFGGDPAFWKVASPMHHLTKDSPPWLGVCSSNRRTTCDDNEAYAEKARLLGAHAEVLGQALSHGEINSELGKPGAYTDAVEAFMAGLNPGIAALLQK